MTERVTWLLATAIVLAGSSGAATLEEKRLVKEERADGSLVLDESGLTQGFEQMLRMMQSLAEVEVDGGSVVVYLQDVAVSSASGIIEIKSSKFRNPARWGWSGPSAASRMLKARSKYGRACGSSPDR